MITYNEIVGLDLHNKLTLNCTDLIITCNLCLSHCHICVRVAKTPVITSALFMCEKQCSVNKATSGKQAWELDELHSLV